MKHCKPHYALLGDGRLARHLRRYLDLLGLPHSGWARNPESSANSHPHCDAGARLRATLAPASHVLLLVSDDAIAGLVRRYPFLHDLTLVHCAGALSLPGIAGAHPLMTFAGQDYALSEYRRIPFVVESGYAFEDILPGLPNPHHTVPVSQKARYHALCVVAGNFPQLLWSAVSARLQAEFQLPPEVLTPYLTRTLENWLADPAMALTGPMARGDRNTISRNLSALEGDALADLYRAFDQFHGQPTDSAMMARERA